MSVASSTPATAVCPATGWACAPTPPGPLVSPLRPAAPALRPAAGRPLHQPWRHPPLALHPLRETELRHLHQPERGGPMAERSPDPVPTTLPITERTDATLDFLNAIWGSGPHS